MVRYTTFLLHLSRNNLFCSCFQYVMSIQFQSRCDLNSSQGESSIPVKVWAQFRPKCAQLCQDGREGGRESSSVCPQPPPYSTPPPSYSTPPPSWECFLPFSFCYTEIFFFTLSLWN
uniref:Uncharacterized protein n=1 Tax=Cacopsylla melanoneura TaxID=428564 RepID=A0A8D9A5D9_9HEMI